MPLDLRTAAMTSKYQLVLIELRVGIEGITSATLIERLVSAGLGATLFGAGRLAKWLPTNDQTRSSASARPCYGP
jgi:hypothetical protein